MGFGYGEVVILAMELEAHSFFFFNVLKYLLIRYDVSDTVLGTVVNKTATAPAFRDFILLSRKTVRYDK